MGLRSLYRSWKTTTVAVLVFAGVLIRVVIAAIDNDPSTVADYNLVIDAALAMLVALGFLAARDSDKSSQDVGIRK